MSMTERERPAVLIADDEPVNLRTLAELLRKDYEVYVAPDGFRALEIAQGSDRPALILLDVSMPELDGYEVCRRLKANDATRDIPVVFITARGGEEDEEKGFLLGAADYVVKPFRPMAVLARVRSQINLKRRTDLLEDFARTDGLTGIPNRRAWDENLIRVWRHCSWNRLPLSVIMVDVDHFKNFNDHYGHGAGDNCLREVALALSRALERPLEFLARYGGEEFVAALPETDEAGARVVAERMVAEVARLGIAHGHSPAAGVVTVSAGCATVSAASFSPPFRENPEDLLKDADHALYKAKLAGRNRVEP